MTILAAQRFNPRSLFIYIYMFFNEFSFFMVLPHLANLEHAKAIHTGALLTYAVLFESVLMILFSSLIRKIHLKTLYFIAPSLLTLAYVCLYTYDGYLSFVLFFTFVGIAKALGKPFSHRFRRISIPRRKRQDLYQRFSRPEFSHCFSTISRYVYTELYIRNLLHYVYLLCNFLS